jgi:uncharacterized protein (DUF1330 family)
MGTLRSLGGGAALSALVLSSVAADEPGPRGPLKVHVVAKPPAPIDKGDEKAIRARAEELEKGLDEDVKAWKKAHGKDARKWADDPRLEYEKRLLEMNQLWASVAYDDSKPKELEDSVENIVNSFGGKGLARKKHHIEVVGSADEAHLVLEVVGRTGGAKFVRSPKYMNVVLRGGALLPKGALEKLPWFWDDEIDVAPIHAATPEEPYIQFQSWSMERWRDVANGTSWVVNYLAKEHYDQLVP